MLSKASAVYEQVLKPLRRLTAATSNALTPGRQQQHQQRQQQQHQQQQQQQNQQPQTGSTPGDKLRPERSCTNECKNCRPHEARTASGWSLGKLREDVGRLSGIGSKSPIQCRTALGARCHLRPGGLSQLRKQQEPQEWRELLRNPLDIILSQPQACGHPVNMSSMNMNRPFSTSAADQARREPRAKQEVKLTRAVLAEKSNNNSMRSRGLTAVMRSLNTGAARKREVGSKKYRKLIQNKLRKKQRQRSNLRRQNRLCMQDAQDIQAFTAGRKPRTLGIDPKVQLALNTCEGEIAALKRAQKDVCTSTPMRAEEGESAVHFNSHLKSETNDNGKSKHTSTQSFDGNGVSPPANTALIPQSVQNSKELRRIAAASNPPSEASRLPAEESSRQICSALSGSEMRKSFQVMRQDLQDSVNGFKCNLWRRAVTGDATIRNSIGCVNYVPCQRCN